MHVSHRRFIAKAAHDDKLVIVDSAKGRVVPRRDAVRHQDLTPRLLLLSMLEKGQAFEGRLYVVSVIFASEDEQLVAVDLS